MLEGVLPNPPVTWLAAVMGHCHDFDKVAPHSVDDAEGKLVHWEPPIPAIDPWPP